MDRKMVNIMTRGMVNFKIREEIDKYMKENHNRPAGAIELGWLKYTTIGHVTVFEFDGCEVCDALSGWDSQQLTNKIQSIIDEANTNNKDHEFFALTRRSYGVNAERNEYSAWH